MWPSVVASGSCQECGWDLSEVADQELGAWMAAQGPAWREAVHGRSRAQLRRRSDPDVWTPLEYTAHVRGVLGTFADRVERMLAEDDPPLVVWDDEAAVVDEAYDEQDPDEVLAGLVAEAERYAVVLGGVQGPAWDRTGRREQVVFTVSSITRYALHESTHHRVDVQRALGSPGDAGAP